MKNRDRLDPPKIKWLVEPTYDDDGVQRSAGLDAQGHEVPDPVPYAVQVGLAPGVDTLHQTLRSLVRDELWRRAMEEEGFESFEESDDFDVEDDMFPVDPHTPYEAVFDPPAPGGGASSTLASEAPNGKGGPAEPPTQPSQKVSLDSVSPVSPDSTVGTPSQSIGKDAPQSSQPDRKPTG